MDCLAFLQRDSSQAPRPVYAVTGDDDFLRRQAVLHLRKMALGDEGEFGLTTLDGAQAEWRDVRDELSTIPFLAPRRLVVLNNADPFVTAHRAALEAYLEKPADRGVLVLVVTKWPANTRLAKLLPDAATLVCKAPPNAKLPEWCARWCQSRHGKMLTASAARMLADLVGAELGRLDQEMAKLAVAVGAAARIDAPDVERFVERGREEKIWPIFDAIGAGNTAQALVLLDRVLEQGEEPMRILGAFSMQLRRLAQAARRAVHGQPITQALQDAGVLPFGLRSAEQLLRHLGRARAAQLYDWLLETDLGMKGSSQLPPRLLLERLVIRLARPQAAPASTARASAKAQTGR